MKLKKHMNMKAIDQGASTNGTASLATGRMGELTASSSSGVWFTGEARADPAGDVAASTFADISWKQLRHAGTYMSAPPMATVAVSAVNR